MVRTCLILLTWLVVAENSNALPGDFDRSSYDIDSIQFISLNHKADDWTFNSRELKKLYSNVTTIHMNARGHGTQVEYTAADGSTYLWYPGNKIIIRGNWKTKRQGNATDICFKYTTPSVNPITGKRSGDFRCNPVSSNQYDVSERLAGDVFGLSEIDEVPFVLDRNEEIIFRHSDPLTKIFLRTKDQDFHRLQGAQIPVRIVRVYHHTIVAELQKPGNFARARIELTLSDSPCFATLTRVCPPINMKCYEKENLGDEQDRFMRQFKNKIVNLVDVEARKRRRSPVELRATAVMKDGSSMGDIMVKSGWGYQHGEQRPASLMRNPECLEESAIAVTE